ncbi:DUF58 domain-containing protein [Ornithinimicrobium faecis]|uniref:DUF58 domain-containing protein n=1 Tax=Ornithinimicrobium faecis TaxID=2934158 RepID=A0ABY4YXH1_9MICO|nr:MULTISPECIES: DUF58 domain-containing protein [unclassified Ornithinimicrobium]USQ81476.1 DUF58 domain-containing protein [Ornithinimicrobium sp. HY1793]
MRAPGVLTSRGQMFLALGAIVAVAGVVLGYRDVTRIGLLLVILPLLALLLVRPTPPSLRVTRVVTPSRLHPDQQGLVEVQFTNVGTRPTPLFLAEEQFDYALGDRPRFLLPRMVSGEGRKLRYTVRSRHRGAFPVGPITLRRRDPFGLTHVALQLPATVELLVLPHIWDLGSRRVAGQGRGTEGELPQMVSLHGEDDVSIRQYRDGDELRRVHWPATAHRGEIMVRQEDRPARRRAVLLLDSRAGAFPGSGYQASYEWAVSAVASLARHLIKDGFVIHLLTHRTVEDGSAGVQIGLDQALSTLARAQPDQDSSMEALAAAAHSFTSGGVLLISVVVAHDEAELAHLAAVREPGSAAMALVLDPEAFTPGTESRKDLATAQRHTGVLTQAGWQTVLVGPQDSVPASWERLRATRRSGALT